MNIKSRPAPKSHQVQIFAQQKRQIWVVFVLIFVAWLIDVYFAQQQVLVKSVLAGAVLSYLAQSVFTWLAYRSVGANMRQVVMLNMYLGQIVKWLLTLLGFALIFVSVKPVNALAVFAGYFLVQLSFVALMWKIGR